MGNTPSIFYSGSVAIPHNGTIHRRGYLASSTLMTWVIQCAAP